MIRSELLHNTNIRILNDQSAILFKRPDSKFIEWSFPETKDIDRVGSFEQLNTKEGFLFFPFDLSSDHPAFAIHSNFNKVELSSILSVEDHVTIMTEDLQNSTSEKEHTGSVEEAIDQIRLNAVKKVVLAKRRSLKGHVDPMSTFIKAARTYHHAFVFLVSLPDIGTWMGATPERILQIENGSAIIDSLAGTQKSQKGDRSRDWTEKEKEEQRIVTAYINDLLKTIELRPEWSPVQDKHAGGLIHLHSSAQFSLPWGGQNIAKVLNELHPTPAVCGTPKKAALELIDLLEKFDRQYYTGVLGPVSKNARTDLFVNLRCMKLFADHVEIFAGGGIIEGSDPQAEWDETEQKCLTMLDLLG